MSVDIRDLAAVVENYLHQQNYRHERTSSGFSFEMNASEENVTLSVDISFICYQGNNGECCMRAIARNPWEISESRKQAVLEYILRAGCDLYEGYFMLVPVEGSSNYQVAFVNQLFTHMNMPSFEDIDRCIGVAIARNLNYAAGLYNVAFENGDPKKAIEDEEQ